MKASFWKAMEVLTFIGTVIMGIPFAAAAGIGCGIACGFHSAFAFHRACLASRPWKPRAAGGKPFSVAKSFVPPVPTTITRAPAQYDEAWKNQGDGHAS